MSAESSILENIEGDIFGDSEPIESQSDDDIESKQSSSIALDDSVDTSPDRKDNNRTGTDKENDQTDKHSVEANRKRASEDKMNPNSNERKRQAIERFCSDEAEKIIREAIVIKHVLDEDKTQFQTSDKIKIDKITGERQVNGGYDRYLIDKLLHSEPDPAEVPFESTECIDVGVRDDTALDDDLSVESDDVKDEADDIVTEEISKDKVTSHQSLLHKEFDLADAFGENALQTINEDTELNLPEKLDAGEDDDGTAQLPEESKEIKSETQTDQQITEEIPDEAVTENPALATKEETEVETSDDEEEGIDEMTYKEKKTVVAAVRNGDIDLLEDLLDKRHADINMLWYNENLIMVAIRAGQEKMAEFLIDNDVDMTHTIKLIERTENGEITTYPQTCRDMAFEKNMEDLVELIDFKTGNLFSFVKPKQRQIRIRRPRPPTPPTPEEESEDEFANENESHKEGMERTMEALTLTEEKLKKFERDLDSGLNSSNNLEMERKPSVPVPNRVHSHSESRENSADETHRESIAESEDSVSHVFGKDEGYETMSPVSPMCAAHPPHPERIIHGAKEFVSIRGTRASYSAKMHKFKTLLNRDNKPKDRMVQHRGLAGCYNRESRRWHQTKSAPSMRTRQSYESIPEVVRTGVPFAHGDKKFTQNQHVTNFHNPVISPYSQVIKMLAGSKLLKPKSASSLPSIRHERANRTDRLSIRTETEYIYADRNCPSLYDRISFLHQPRVSTAGSVRSRPRNAW